MFAELFTGLVLLALMKYKAKHRDFPALTMFLTAFVLDTAIAIPLLFFRKDLGISVVRCYEIYFYSNWIFFTIEYVLLLLIIYSVFSKAMKPLEGLHHVGKVIFRWIAGVSLALSVAVVAGPHLSGGYGLATLAGQIQEGTSILMLCLLLFVGLATRALGLTYRSHIFGVSLGLGIFATTTLVESAWFSSGVGQTLYSPVYIFSTLGTAVALMTWGAYFATPEPERKMILLPTTSPYFFWNAISEALGDAPGFVAIAGFKPSMMAPAELKALSAASIWARERDAELAREAEEQAAARREAEALIAKEHAANFHATQSSIAMTR
jgi:hypothetical protein